MISIVVPTIKGREDHYERCVTAYQERTADDIQLITLNDRPSCGVAWQEGSLLSSGDYIHFTADDLEPLENWDVEARDAADVGKIPAPLIYHGASDQVDQIGPVLPDGFFSRIPFCTREQWQKIGPMIPIHYYTDNYFSWRAELAGYEMFFIPSYAFRHHWAMVGRGATAGGESQQMMNDEREYARYKREGYVG